MLFFNISKQAYRFGGSQSRKRPSKKNSDDQVRRDRQSGDDSTDHQSHSEALS
jgi:hypothetical protein